MEQVNPTMPITPKYPPKYKQRKFLEMIFDSVGFLSDCPQRYPDIMRFSLLNQHSYVLQNPDYVRYVLQENYKNYRKGKAYETLSILLGNGLIISEGEFWKRQRRLSQPAFHRESLMRISQIVIDSTQKMINEWKQKVGKQINFTREMAGLTIEIVASTV